MRLRRLIPDLVLGILAIVVASGCSALVQSDRVQCSTDGDCAARGGAFANSVCVSQLCQAPGPWDCLGKVVWPTPSSGTVTVVLNLTDIITSQPVADVGTRVCRKLDPVCAEPLLTDIVSDAQGRAIMILPQGFDGYVELTAKGTMPGIYFFYPPLTSDRDVQPIPLLQANALTTFAALAGANVMADRGHVMARAYNCLGQTAEGVSFSSAEGDSATTPFYMIKNVPSTKQSETDSSGQGGLLNLRPGTATLTGTLASGAPMATLGVLTRPGQVTYTALIPAPQ